jgi:hypothetical protein
MGRLGGEIILLHCCKRLQINRTFFQVVISALPPSSRGPSSVVSCLAVRFQHFSVSAFPLFCFLLFPLLSSVLWLLPSHFCFLLSQFQLFPSELSPFNFSRPSAPLHDPFVMGGTSANLRLEHQASLRGYPAPTLITFPLTWQISTT